MIHERYIVEFDILSYMLPLLSVEDLQVSFSSGGKPLHAVRGISFQLNAGEALGIVGESGSGKSAAVQAITRLTPGSIKGRVLFNGKETLNLGTDVGMVFQDPMTSLNPTMKIGAQIAEGLIYHRLSSSKEALIKAEELLSLAGISEPKLRLHQYPHQLSGGMRQRVMIAIAIACNPRLLIADEPTTALDVTIQSQILSLINQMRSRFHMGLLLISHDFNVIAQVCEQVLVMYAGKIVERGRVDEVLQSPRHPYTQMLLNARPSLSFSKTRHLEVIEGAPPNLSLPLTGCSFKERCPFAALKCLEEPTGAIACWRVE